jgi:hypothetical protein
MVASDPEDPVGRLLLLGYLALRAGEADSATCGVTVCRELIWRSLTGVLLYHHIIFAWPGQQT